MEAQVIKHNFAIGLHNHSIPAASRIWMKWTQTHALNVILSYWINEWGIYIALYCVLLYTQSALQSYGGICGHIWVFCRLYVWRSGACWLVWSLWWCRTHYFRSDNLGITIISHEIIHWHSLPSLKVTVSLSFWWSLAHPTVLFFLIC